MCNTVQVFAGDFSSFFPGKHLAEKYFCWPSRELGLHSPKGWGLLEADERVTYRIGNLGHHSGPNLFPAICNY